MTTLESIKDVHGILERIEADSGPIEWRQFLAEIGYGALDERFSFYSGLASPSDIFDSEIASQMPSNLQFFGDDMAGASFGFVENSTAIFMVDATAPEEVVEIEDSFDNFLKSWFLD